MKTPTAPPNHGQRGHSRLAPSAASRWTVCTASPAYLQANAYRIVERSSRYADEGSRAHEVAEAIMRGEPIPEGTSEETLRYVTGYVDFCKSLTPDGVINPRFVEVEVPLFYKKEDSGHVDFATMSPERDEVCICDYKHGAGVKVHADYNKQLATYARSFVEEYDLAGWVNDTTKIRISIYQPRCRDLLDDFDDLTVEPSENEPAKSVASTWVVSWSELLLFTEKEIGIPAQLIQDNATHLLKFVSSESTCKWCPASSFCDTRVAALAVNAPVIIQMMQPEPMNPTPPEEITDDKLAQILRHAPDIKKWLNSCEEYAFNRAVAGNPLPGTKLITGRGSRKWEDEAAAATLLESANVEPYERKLISPFNAEKLLKEAGFGKSDFHTQALEKITQRVPGGPKLTSIADPRPEWKPAVDALTEFEILTPAE